jgi:hypothetical protein
MKVETKNIYNGSTAEGKTMINESAKTVGRGGKKERVEGRKTRNKQKEKVERKAHKYHIKGRRNVRTEKREEKGGKENRG